MGKRVVSSNNITKTFFSLTKTASNYKLYNLQFYSGYSCVAFMVVYFKYFQSSGTITFLAFLVYSEKKRNRNGPLLKKKNVCMNLNPMSM